MRDELSIELSKYSDNAKEAYLGALHALQQKEYPDRIVHFAQSLREVVDQLARFSQFPECEKPQGKIARKECLQKTFDLLGYQEPLDHLLDRLAGMYARLSEVAHHNERISDVEAHSVLSEAEEILDQLIIPRFGIDTGTDEMLKGPPSLDRAQKIVASQARPANSPYLIGNLDPSWLPYMKEAGFFESPPHVGKNQELLDYRPWLPASYLRKCAKTRDKDVAEIILSCKFASQPHPLACIDFLKCATCMTAEDTEGVARKALEENWARFVWWDSFAAKYVEVAEKLYLGGRYDISVCMLMRALRLELSEPRRTAPGDAVTGLRELAVPIGEHRFQKILRKMPELARENPLPIIKLLDGLFYESVVLDNRRNGRDSGYDDGGHWRMAVEDAIRSPPVSIQWMLVSRLRDCVVGAVRDGAPEALKILYARDHSMYRRLELHTYAEFPDKLDKEAELSALWYCDRPRMHHEHYRLLETAFSRLPARTKEKIIERIDRGFDSGLFESIKRARGEARATAAERRWKLCLLEPIKPHLDPDHKSMYENLIKEMGRPASPEYHPYMGIFDEGPDPAMFDGKGPDDVFEIVKKYEPPEPFVFHKDAAEAFATYVKDNPLECSQRALDLVSAPLRIQYELFRGLRDAVRNDGRIEWKDVLSLIGQVVESGVQNTTPGRRSSRVRGTGQRPAHIYSPLPPLFSLVEEGLKRDSLGFGLGKSVQGVLEKIVKIGNASTESKYPDKIGSLEMSRANLNGMSFYTVFQYAAWCHKHGEKQTMAKRIFDDYLGGQKHTASRHAVLGACLPGFYRLDREWARSLLQRVMSSKRGCVQSPKSCRSVPRKLQPSRLRIDSKDRKIAFWDGYVSGRQMYAHVFGELWKWYDKFTNKGIARDLDMAQIHESTIAHVMLAYFYGLEHADDIVEKLLRLRDCKSMARCVQQTGFILRGSGGDPNFDGKKLANLWKHPAFGNHDLGMWFVNTPLDRKISIDMYLDHIKRHRGKIRMTYNTSALSEAIVGGEMQHRGKIQIVYNTVYELAKYAKDLPEEVAECLEVLIGKYADGAVPKEFREVLATVCKSEDPHVKARCNKVVVKAAGLKLDWRDLVR